MADKKAPKETLPATAEGLDARARELREKIRKLRFDQAAGQVDDTSLFQKARRDLARSLTARKALDGKTTG